MAGKMKIRHGNIGDEFNTVSSEFLEINNCGVSNYTMGDYTTVRENGRNDYQMIYIKSGKMTAFCIDKTVVLQKGDIIFHHPHDIYNYTYLEKDKYESLWLQFSGQGVEKTLAELGLLHRRLFSIDCDEELEFLFSRLIPEHKLKRRGYKSFETALLLQILGQISRNDRILTDSESPVKAKFEHVLIKMEGDVTRSVPIEKYAEDMNLSLSRFAHIFTETVGISPHKYILNLKISKAKQMLRQTDMNIGEVAQYVGFSDSLYFSRIFKKHTGITPSEYRNGI